MTESELHVRLSRIEDAIQTLTQTLLEKSQFEIQRQLTRTLFDDLSIRIERVEERFATLATALTEG